MMQITELHFRRIPACDYAAVKARAQELLESDLGSSDPGESDKAFLIVHKDHPVKYSDGDIPAQTAILASDQPLRLLGVSARHPTIVALPRGRRFADRL